MDNKETSKNQLLDFLKKLGFIAQEKVQEPVVIKEIKKELKCKECGKTFSQVKEEGHLECDSCYPTFGPLVLNNLRRLTGEPLESEKPKTKLKKPSEKKPKNIEDFLRKLEASLNQSIKKEHYEDAAKLRDKIKSVKEVLEKVKSVREKIKELVKAERFEEAKEIKKQLDEIVKNCINNQS